MEANVLEARNKLKDKMPGIKESLACVEMLQKKKVRCFAIDRPTTNTTHPPPTQPPTKTP